jgi:hypothetical protein
MRGYEAAQIVGLVIGSDALVAVLRPWLMQ